VQDDTWRDHLANERTHLAWLRTGAAVVVVGLAVVRFAVSDDVTAWSVAAGLPLALVGLGAIVYGTYRYRHAYRRLQAGDPRPPGTLGPSLGAGLLVVALVVTGVVLVTHR
jgi:putative membrane protein